MNFEGLWRDFRVGDDPRHREQPKLTLKINGSNYGRPKISDEPVRRPTDIETSTDRSDHNNGHTSESEFKARSRPTTSPTHVIATTTPVESSAPVPATRTITPANPSGAAPAALNCNDAHAVAPAPAVTQSPSTAVTPAGSQAVAPSSALPAIDADVVKKMIAAVGTLQETIDRLQGLLQGLVSVTAVASPPAAPPAVPSGTPAMPEPPSAPVAVTTPAAIPTAGADLVALMLDVVADKTGYPIEMLDLSMELEADLGIDSIKRIEILSAVQGRIPAVSDVEAATMSTLATLQEIIDYLQTPITSAAPSGTPAMPVSPSAPVAVTTSAATSPASTDLVALMLDVVADKTGYPIEMLDLSMELEADLGIDSIKRIEILSAVQGRIAELSDVDTATMSTLATLQEIIDYLQP